MKHSFENKMLTSVFLSVLGISVFWTTIQVGAFANASLVNTRVVTQATPTLFSALSGIIPGAEFMPNRRQSSRQEALVNYLSIYKYRESVRAQALKLNGGKAKNACVFFASEALRRVGEPLSLGVCNTGKLIKETNKNISLSFQLQNAGWKTSFDPSLLMPGDICFTTPDASGRPTHTYVFMGWLKEGSYDYAYVCDNQAHEYGATLHIRNVKIATKTKEAFQYFMYFPQKQT